MPRYIDADDLRDNVLNDNTYDSDTVNYYLGWIDDAPTADVVPVVRGERRRQMSEVRPIDANALIKDLIENRGFLPALVRHAILNAPTIGPVKNGEWILVGTNEHDYETSVEEKCSLCGRYAYRYDTQPQDNFCPNCGADNRGSEVKE